MNPDYQLNNPNNLDTITIKQDDLNTPEKKDKFIDLFGRSTYFKVFHNLSEQRYGDGMIQAIENKMASLDMKSDEDLQKFEALKARRTQEAKKLKSAEKAAVELPIYSSFAESVYSNKELAQEYLGSFRYNVASGFTNGRDAVTDESLLKNNPHIRKVEAKDRKIQEKIDQLEREKKRLQKSRGETD